MAVYECGGCETVIISDDDDGELCPACNGGLLEGDE